MKCCCMLNDLFSASLTTAFASISALKISEAFYHSGNNCILFLSLDLLGPSPLFVIAYPFLPVLDSSCFVNKKSPVGLVVPLVHFFIK